MLKAQRLEEARQKQRVKQDIETELGRISRLKVNKDIAKKMPQSRLV
jgi:hypothetical protein